MPNSFNLAKSKTAARGGRSYTTDFDDIDSRMDEDVPAGPSGNTGPMQSFTMPEAEAPVAAPQPVSPAQDAGRATRTMVRAMQEWVAAAATDIRTAPSPDQIWFSTTTPENMDQAPLSLFFSTAERVLANPAFGMPSREERRQWLAGIVRAFKTQDGALPPEESPVAEATEAPQPRRRSRRRDQGDDSPVAVKDVNLPHVKNFLSLFGDKVFKQFSERRNVRSLQSGHEAVQNALMTAFGTADNGVGRNDMRFFLEPKGWKFLPDDIKSKMLAARGRDDQAVAKMPGGERQGFEVEESQSLASDPAVYQRLGNVLNDVITVAGSPDAAKVEEAKARVPVLANLGTQEARAAAHDAVMDRVNRQVNANLSNSDMEQRRQFGKTKDFTGIDRDNGGAGGRGEGMAAGHDQVSAETDTVTQVSQQFQAELPTVANNVRKLGRDLSSFLMRSIARPDSDPAKKITEYPKSGRPKYDRYKDAPKYGVALRRYTEILAEELDRLGDPDNIDKLKGYVGSVVKTMTKRMQGQVENPVGGTPAPQRLGDDPHEVDAIRKMHGDDYGRYTEYKPNGGQVGDAGIDRSVMTGFFRPKMGDLVSNAAFARALSQKVRQSGSTIFGQMSPVRDETAQTDRRRGGEGLVNDPKNAQDIRSQLSLMFAYWGPFLLLPEVMSKYDVVTRRVVTDAMPVRVWYREGTGPQGRLALLYHAVRGELDRAPQSLGATGGKNKMWNLPEAMDLLNKWKATAAKNRRLPAIMKNWHKASTTLALLKSSRTRLSNMKSASADTSYMDATIVGLEGYVRRQETMYWQAMVNLLAGG